MAFAVASFDYADFLDFYKDFFTNWNDRLIEFLTKPDLCNLAQNYYMQRERSVQVGFNVFELVSDTYRRENFHSDIIKSLLDPKEAHGYGPAFLHLFIDFLNSFGRGKILLDKNDFLEAEVLREHGHIDILIVDLRTRKAILIENKINKAIDQPRQIPRYIALLDEKGVTVQTVVYLLLNYHIRPTSHDWSDAEKQKIDPLLIIVQAWHDTRSNLVNHWLKACAEMATGETQMIIKQYASLIHKLGESSMNKEILNDFYQHMLDKKQYETAKALTDMMNDLPAFRAERLVDHFSLRHYPFEKAWCYARNCAVIDLFRLNNSAYAIDIIAEPNFYRFQFFLRHGVTPTATEVLNAAGLMEGFVPNGVRWERKFQFPEQEQEVYALVETFKKQLQILRPAPFDEQTDSLETV